MLFRSVTQPLRARLGLTVIVAAVTAFVATAIAHDDVNIFTPTEIEDLRAGQIAVTGSTTLDGPIELGSVTTPSALASGTTQNYDPGTRNLVYRLTAHASNSALGGLVAPASGHDEVHIIHNVGSGNLTFNYIDSGSTSANRFLTPRAMALSIASNGSVLVRYDATDSLWRIVSWTGEAFGVRSSGGPIPTCFPTWADGTGTLTASCSTADDGATLLLGASRAINAAGVVTFTNSTAPTFDHGLSANGGALIRQPQWIDRIVPAALTSGSTTNDWNPTDIHTQMFVAVETTTSSLATLTGIAGPLNGELKTLCNHGPGPLKLLHNNTGSVAANRFKLADGEDAVLGVGFVELYCIGFRYNSNSNRYEENWRNFYGNNSGGAPTLSAGSLGTGSRNQRGDVTSVGATTTTLTYSTPFTNRSWCTATGNGAAQVITVTRSASAPVFSCFDMAGVAQNCNDFSYTCWGN